MWFSCKFTYWVRQGNLCCHLSTTDPATAAVLSFAFKWADNLKCLPHFKPFVVVLILNLLSDPRFFSLFLPVLCYAFIILFYLQKVSTSRSSQLLTTPFLMGLLMSRIPLNTWAPDPMYVSFNLKAIMAHWKNKKITNCYKGKDFIFANFGIAFMFMINHNNKMMIPYVFLVQPRWV